MLSRRRGIPQPPGQCDAVSANADSGPAAPKPGWGQDLCQPVLNSLPISGESIEAIPSSGCTAWPRRPSGRLADTIVSENACVRLVVRRARIRGRLLWWRVGHSLLVSIAIRSCCTGPLSTGSSRSIAAIWARLAGVLKLMRSTVL